MAQSDGLIHPCPLCEEREDDATLDGMLPLMPFDRRFCHVLPFTRASSICHRCGQNICAECTQSFCKASFAGDPSTWTGPSCPFCRAPFDSMAARTDAGLRELTKVASLDQPDSRRVHNAKRTVANALLRKKNPRDECRAVAYYTSAAEHGDPRSMFYLAMCYRVGKGCSINEEQSRMWLRRAASQGLACAQYELSEALLGSDPVTASDTNKVEAVALLRALVNQGYEDAYVKLGMLLNIPGPQSHVASATIALRRAIAVEKKYPGPNQSKLIASLSGFVNRNYDLLLNEPAPPSTHCRTCTIHLGARAMKCSRCLQVNYCSKECQKAHWKRGHKGECS